MDFELHPAITLGFRAFHVLVAPAQMLVDALNSHLNLQRFEVLYVCGNYSRILSGLDRRFTALEVRRAFTAFQLMTILEENRHTLLILEHDPLLYEDAREMVEYVALAMKEASKSSLILILYHFSWDHFPVMRFSYLSFHIGSESFIGWNLNQPDGHAIIKYWFIQEWSSWGTSTGSHAVNEFQKLQPISESRPFTYKPKKYILVYSYSIHNFS